jgi:serine/threonine protein phosphatase PrpC
MGRVEAKPLATSLMVTEAEHEQAELQRLAVGTCAIYSHCAPDKESPNEDALVLIPCGDDAAVLVVADGLGGGRAGKEASRLAVQMLREAVESVPAERLREAILGGIESANQAILDLALGAATTVAVAEIQGDTMRSYYVGDSMILVCGQRGKVKFQSVAHSPVGYAVEAGLIDESEAVHHEDRHIVSNVVGTAEMRIEIGPTIELAPRDTVVLASDGLADNLYNEEIVEQVRKGPLLKAANALAAVVQGRMTNPSGERPHKPDDLTYILFRRNP